MRSGHPGLLGALFAALFAVLTAVLSGPLAGAARADQVIADSLRVEGGLCVGFDCLGETFPSDMIRVKENNVRIVLRDESVADGAPNVDWEMSANEAGSTGRSRFSIDDLNAGTFPLWITGGAPTDSLHLTTEGLLGIGTASPESTLHVAGPVRIDGDLVITGGLRAGRVEAAALDAGGRATVTFARPYTRDYAITLMPVLSGAKGDATAVVVSHDPSGFTFDLAGKPGDYVEIAWTTRFVGEF